MDRDRSVENIDENSVGEQPMQAECGMCGQVLDPETDDFFVELCRACEYAALKTRQTRGHVPAPHPRRF